MRFSQSDYFGQCFQKIIERKQWPLVNLAEHNGTRFDDNLKACEKKEVVKRQCAAQNKYVSLQLRVQNAVSAQPCVGKFRISLVLLNFLHCNFRLWFETT